MKNSFLINDQGRECSKCEQFKDWSQYHAGSSANGKSGSCKDCKNEADRKRRAEYRSGKRKPFTRNTNEARKKKRIDEYGRECFHCKVYKSWSEFHKGSSANAKCPNCKICQNRLNRIRQGGNPETPAKYKIDKNGRECTECKIYLPWNKFNKRTTRNGSAYGSKCKQCISIKYKDQNTSKRNEAAKKWQHLKDMINPQTGKKYARGEKYNGEYVMSVATYRSIPDDYKGEFRPLLTYKFERFIEAYCYTTISRRLRQLREGNKAVHGEVDIDFDYLISIFPMDMVCPVFNIQMTFVAHKHNSIQLDRIDASRGYIKGNCAWICAKANRTKGDSTSKELQLAADWLKRKGF